MKLHLGHTILVVYNIYTKLHSGHTLLVLYTSKTEHLCNFMFVFCNSYDNTTLVQKKVYSDYFDSFLRPTWK